MDVHASLLAAFVGGTPASARQRQRLRRSRVLVVGVGGLGSPAALYLAGAGVGTLGLMEDDTVDLSNLHRQILYATPDVGRPKLAVAAERIAAVSPHTRIVAVPERLSALNALRIVRQFDFVIDATDQVASKYLVNDCAVLSQRSFSHAGVLGFQGQVLTVLPRRSACVRCLFPIPPPEGEIPTCQEAGVIGALVGVIAAVQAAEALKYLLEIGTLFSDRLLTYDAATREWRTVPLRRNPCCALCGDAPTIRTLMPAKSVPQCPAP